MLLLKSIVMLGLLFFSTIPLCAAQVTLAWDANSPTPDHYQVFSARRRRRLQLQLTGMDRQRNHLHIEQFVLRHNLSLCRARCFSKASKHRFQPGKLSPSIAGSSDHGIGGRRRRHHPIGEHRHAPGRQVKSFNITPQPGYRIARCARRWKLCRQRMPRTLSAPFQKITQYRRLF
jgi:hypothetical protein